METIVYDAISYSSSNTLTLEFNHTISNGTNRYIAVCVVLNDTTLSNLPVVSVSYNNVALELVRYDQSTSGVRTEWWYGANPAAGTHEISITKTAAIQAIGAAVSFHGPAQIAPAVNSGNNGSSTSPSTSITPAIENSILVDVLAHLDGAATIGNSQIERLNYNAPSYIINEDMDSDPGWTLAGDASQAAYISGYIRMNQASSDKQGQAYTNVATFPVNYTIEAQLWAGGGSGADSGFIFWGCSSVAGMENAARGGYCASLNEYYDKVFLYWNGTKLDEATLSNIDNSTIKNVEIIVTGTNVKMYVDDALLIDYDDTSRSFPGTYTGVGARNGSLTNEHRCYDFKVYSTSPICVSTKALTTTSTETTSWTLDSSAAWVTSAIILSPASSPYLYDSIKYYIDDVDRTEYISARSLTINDEVNSKINTCSFRTFDASNVWKPDVSESIEIFDAYGNRIFSGVIASVDETRIGIDPTTGSELLSYMVQAQDYTKQLQKKLVIETYEDMTCKEIIEAMINKYYSQEGFTTVNVSTGPVVSQISFNYKAGDKVLDDLANAVGYEWYVDYDKDIHFFNSATASSMFTFTDATENWTNLSIKPDTSQLRNRIYIRGGIYYSDPFTQEIKADGTQKEFLLAYTPDYDGFTATIASVARSVGIKDVDQAADYDFLLNRAEKSLAMGETTWALANTPIAADTILTLVYNYEIPVLIVQEDTDSIEAMKTLEGGDGVYEYIIIDKNITSISAARDRALAELNTYANAITRGSVDSYDTVNIQSGNLITINSTQRGLNADYLVTKVKINQISPTQLKYTIEFTGTLYNFVDFLLALYKRSTDILLGKDEVLDAFNTFSDHTDAVTHIDPVLTDSAPPFAWSNDEGTTPNKIRWNLFEWYSANISRNFVEEIGVFESITITKT